MIKLVRTDRKPDFTGVTPAFVACATLVLFVVIAGFFVGKHLEKDLSPCLFKRVTGEPCVLCGGTRATYQLVTGNPAAAFRYNPLVTALLCLAGLMVVLKFIFAKKVVLGGSRRWLWVCVVAVVLANWIYIYQTLE